MLNQSNRMAAKKSKSSKTIKRTDEVRAFAVQRCVWYSATPDKEEDAKEGLKVMTAADAGYDSDNNDEEEDDNNGLGYVSID